MRTKYGVLFGLMGRLIIGRLISGLCWVCEEYKDEEGCVVMSQYWKSAENSFIGEKEIRSRAGRVEVVYPGV